MTKIYEVLIVEDDFRIADIHQQFVENKGGFSVTGSVRTGREALDFLENRQVPPDLILLDMYIPDVEGMELFRKIRSQYRTIDIIIISAANETETIHEAVRAGVFDYIIKPVELTRFEEALRRYKEKQQYIQGKTALAQSEIDQFIFSGKDEENMADNLPKGIDAITLNEITSFLTSVSENGITAVDLSRQIGTSRSTARRYLEYLVSIREIETRLKYGSVGRPERKYFPRETYEQNE